MADDVLLRLKLKCDKRAPRVVRASLSSLDEVGGCAQELALVSSELVSNAVIHSGCDSRDRLDVSLARCKRGYRLSVSDPGRSGKSAKRVVPRTSGHGGLGLGIVETLAERWGERRDRHYHVWAEVSASGSPALAA